MKGGIKTEILRRGATQNDTVLVLHETQHWRTPMAQSDHERVGKALELLNQALRPFVERELKAVYGEAGSMRLGRVSATIATHPR